MDVQTLNSELAQYGNIAYSSVTNNEIIAFVESVTLSGYKAIFDYIETLSAEYPLVVSIGYDGSSVKFQLLSQLPEGDVATDNISEA
jgi:hypothetical protein